MHPSTALATVFVDELARHGVRDAVLCPGSRSAPLAYALQDADRRGLMRLHVRTDERAAGFLALGLAKLSCRVVPVVTTSGTAVANLHPAVLEASHADVPLLVLSADRPPEMQGTGANQTTRQPGIFGDAPRWSHELGCPALTPGQNAVWRSVASRACAAALGSLGTDPGPVHLNVPLRDPLVPLLCRDEDRGHVEGTDWPDSLEGRADGAPWVKFSPAAAGAAAPLSDEPRTLLVLGDLPRPELAAEALDLARAACWPVVAEPFGAGDRRGVMAHGPLLLTATGWLEEHLPARVVVVGRPTLSRAVAGLPRDPRVTLEVVAPGARWADPSHQAERVHPWGTIAATAAVHTTAATSRADPAWLREWSEASLSIAPEVDQAIHSSWPSGPSVADVMMRDLPKGSVLFAGSSNAVRDLDIAQQPQPEPEPEPDDGTAPDAQSTPTAQGTPTARGVTVLASRGLAGIDGCLSTAVGIALSQPGRPAYALVGDLTFLHDAGGLLIGPQEPRPDLTIVVVNDDGGGIFTLLEPGEPARAGDFERVFGTPTGASLADICKAYRVPHLLATGLQTLSAAVAARPSGLRVVEVRVDRSAHRDLHAELRRVAAAALAKDTGRQHPTVPSSPEGHHPHRAGG